MQMHTDWRGANGLIEVTIDDLDTIQVRSLQDLPEVLKVLSKVHTVVMEVAENVIEPVLGTLAVLARLYQLPSDRTPVEESRKISAYGLYAHVTLKVSDADEVSFEQTQHLLKTALIAVDQLVVSQLGDHTRSHFWLTIQPPLRVFDIRSYHLLSDLRPHDGGEGKSEGDRGLLEYRDKLAFEAFTASRPKSWWGEECGDIKRLIEDTSPEDVSHENRSEWRFPESGHDGPFTFGNRSPFGSF